MYIVVLLLTYMLFSMSYDYTPFHCLCVHLQKMKSCMLLLVDSISDYGWLSENLYIIL